VLGVPPGGYYGWRGRPVSPRTQRREALVDAIKAVHGEVKARYGSPRIHVELGAFRLAEREWESCSLW